VLHISYCCVSPELSDEQKEMQLLARKFAREEIIPVAPHHDQTGEVRSEVNVGTGTACLLVHEDCLGNVLQY